jgi:hypothetical protein
MGAPLALGKVICFHCRRSNCSGACPAPGKKLHLIGRETRRALAWLAGACAAGGAFGAALALLLGA